MKPLYYQAVWHSYLPDVAPPAIRWPTLVGLIQRLRELDKTPYSVQKIEAVMDTGAILLVPEPYYRTEKSTSRPIERQGRRPFLGRSTSTLDWHTHGELIKLSRCFEKGHRQLRDDPDNPGWESCGYCGIIRRVL